MGNDGWMDISTCPVTTDPKEARKIIVWHVFQGAMVYSTMTARENRFNVYWREPPETWIDPHDRMPTREDADALSCILVIDRTGTCASGDGSRLKRRMMYSDGHPARIRRRITGNYV